MSNLLSVEELSLKDRSTGNEVLKDISFNLREKEILGEKNKAPIQECKSDGSAIKTKEAIDKISLKNNFESLKTVNVNTEGEKGKLEATAGSPESKTDESEAMSKSLKKNGFKFVGPTTCYSLMQSCGFVIDHPLGTKEWKASFNRLKKRKGGFQDRRYN